MRETARRFAEAEIAPIAAELDESEAYPADLYRSLAAAGLFGITVPEALGGAGADALAYALVMEELSRGYASVADQVGLVELLGTLITQHGTPAQQARYLVPLLKAERRCAYALTEAGAGSDLGSLKTEATARWRGLGPERREIVDPQRAGRRLRRRAGAHRPGGGASGDVGVPGGTRQRRRVARAARAQDGPARLAGRRADLRRCAAAGRCAARHRGARLPHDDVGARQGARRASRRWRSAS